MAFRKGSIVLVVMLLFGSVSALADASIDAINTMGGQIGVTLYGEAESVLWLGCTIVMKSGEELDLPAKKVSQGRVSSMPFVWSSFDIGLGDIKKWDRIDVGLWKKKVRCNQNDPKARDGCRKFGYLLDGQVDFESTKP